MTRFDATPKWPGSRPPTMSPSETRRREGYLEYPDDAFPYSRHEGADAVVCQQKHMGSRAVVIVCRDEAATKKRFGVAGEGIGICYTRTGRRFFTDSALETAFLSRLHAALTAAHTSDLLGADWVCL